MKRTMIFNARGATVAESVTQVGHHAACFVVQWDFSHKISCGAAQNKFDGWTFPLFREVRVHAPTHHVVHPVPEKVGRLHFRTPRRRCTKVTSLPISEIMRIRRAWLQSGPSIWSEIVVWLLLEMWWSVVLLIWCLVGHGGRRGSSET